MEILSIQTFYRNHEGLLQIIAIGSAIIIGYFSLFMPLFSYLRSQRKLRRDKRFETYHKLIDDLVGATANPKLDRQIAIVFEMRRFSEYYPVTKRILLGLKDQWTQAPPSGVKSNPHIHRIIAEIDFTIKYIDSNCFKRNFCSRNL
ncbi:MAG: hypothetical protein CVT92_15125 [Bacteroidetes bacterium HGW-Bacteroidetes-1]|nr:MAG: hypothetical protein CVT92_15125 [Bacteroidetes bacterium HGW-Bacteroidetes-1]